MTQATGNVSQQMKEVTNTFDGSMRMRAFLTLFLAAIMLATTTCASKTIKQPEPPLSPDQVITPAENGTCTLLFTTQSKIEVVKWVLGFGADAELIAPENLRQKAIEEHTKALERYRKV